MLVAQQPVLRKFWYAIMPISHLLDGPKPFTLLGEKIVLWCKPDGTPAALRDRCCHRTAQLSKGFVEGENIVCGYHGWTYNCEGQCVRIPQNSSDNIPTGAKVQAFHCQEKYGYAWVALDTPLKPIPDFPEENSGKHRRIFQFYEEWKTSPVRRWKTPSTTLTFLSCIKPTLGCSINRSQHLMIFGIPTMASRPKPWCRSETHQRAFRSHYLQLRHAHG